MKDAMDRLPLLNNYVEYWAEKTPEKEAMIQHEDGKTVTYGKFKTLIDFFALKLLDMGIGRGDRVATQLVLIPEHIIFMYACFKIGAIIAPLDLRLKEEEVVRDLGKIKPKAFFFLAGPLLSILRKSARLSVTVARTWNTLSSLHLIRSRAISSPAPCQLMN